MEPRSSRLKDRKKGEGEMLIKELFFQDMVQNNDMLHILGKGSSVVLLPQNTLSQSYCSKMPVGFELNPISRLFPSLCSPELELKSTGYNARDEFTVNRKQGMKRAVNRRTFYSLFGSIEHPSFDPKEEENYVLKKASQSECGLLSCVACGILCFACVAIVQPTEAAARYIMSADCSLLSKWGESDNDPDHVKDANTPNMNLCSASMLRKTKKGILDEARVGGASDSKARKEPSSLCLLALAYGNSSDSDEEEAEAEAEAEVPAESCGATNFDNPENGYACDNTDPKNKEISLQNYDSTAKDEEPQTLDCSDEFQTNDSSVIELNYLTHRFRNQMKSHDTSNYSLRKAVSTLDGTTVPFSSRSDKDSSRFHVFCLHHAMQVEKRLCQVGGANVFLICHPDYLKLESQAKKVAEELERDHHWYKISFNEATEKDEETIRLALESENAIHDNGDWAVKLGINLFYSANLSRSPLYSKQMHYNSVIYSAFGRSSSSESSSEVEGKCLGRLVAGKWCGKVWTSNQAHWLLVNKDSQQEEMEKKSERPSNERILYAIRRTSRKRKNNNSSENSSCKKQKTEKINKSSVSFSLKEVKRNHCLRRSKEDNSESENLEGSSEELLGDSCKQIKSKRVDKKPKEENAEDVNLEDSSEEIPLSKSWKQIKKSKRGLRRRVKEETPPDPPVENHQQNSKKQQLISHMEGETEGGPSARLRKRPRKPCKDSGKVNIVALKKQQREIVTKKGNKDKMGNVEEADGEYACDVEGCAMSFGSKQELALHKRNICPVKGCGKKFFSHKYLVQHRRVHVDDRPLKCPWKGCKMTFKWAWARTEHIRVHTGARPYVCTETGCGQTFRFVSDFSRHKRKTGHAPKKARK